MKALGMLGECARDMPAPSHSVSTASGLLQLYAPSGKGVLRDIYSPQPWPTAATALSLPFPGSLWSAGPSEPSRSPSPAQHLWD